MNAKQLVDDLRGRGARLEADGESLAVDAPAGLVTDELKSLLVEHKARVLGILRFETDYGLTWDHERQVWADSGGYAYDGACFESYAHVRRSRAETRDAS